MKRKKFILIFKRNVKSNLQEEYTKEIKQLQVEVHNSLCQVNVGNFSTVFQMIYILFLSSPNKPCSKVLS